MAFTRQQAIARSTKSSAYKCWHCEMVLAGMTLHDCLHSAHTGYSSILRAYHTSTNTN